jgi:hypothetical protein
MFTLLPKKHLKNFVSATITLILVSICVAPAAYARIAVNRLSVERITANRAALNRLAEKRLLVKTRGAANPLLLNVDSAKNLLTTAEGRELLGFIVNCAIPLDQTLVADFNGEHLEFFGELGLTPEWLDHPLTDKGKGWMSACLLARVSNTDVPIAVSFRGPNTALASDPDELSAWTLEEGAFYGNLFRPLNQQAAMFACRGKDLASGVSGGLIDRDCAKPDPARPGLTMCGFTYAGDCGAFAARHACENFSRPGTFYKECHTSPSVSAHDDDGGDDDVTFRQVITTYVLP